MARSAFGVTFDDAALAEDLAHASAPGRVAALDARRQFAGHGIEVGLLRPCRDEGRDGTRLPGCVKTYLPAPIGDWGMVEGRLDSPPGGSTDRNRPANREMAAGDTILTSDGEHVDDVAEHLGAGRAVAHARRLALIRRLDAS